MANNNLKWYSGNYDVEISMKPGKGDYLVIIIKNARATDRKAQKESFRFERYTDAFLYYADLMKALLKKTKTTKK